MKNGDMPVTPILQRYVSCNNLGIDNRVELGLTKREAFAMAALQGVIACPEATLYSNQQAIGLNQPDSIAQYAAACADALLAELERTS